MPATVLALEGNPDQQKGEFVPSGSCGEQRRLRASPLPPRVFALTEASSSRSHSTVLVEAVTGCASFLGLPEPVPTSWVPKN